MAFGPGKYDDICTYVRLKAEATGAIVIIIGGDKGEGFSCQADLETTAMLPTMLRSMADDIEASMKGRQ